MKTLVSVASKHGGTHEIGERIAARLRADGLDVDVFSPEFRPIIEQYDAFVIGSAVYMGRWMAEGRRLVTENAALLRLRPVWLFSSGPITGAKDPADSDEGEHLLSLVEGRQHRLFAGRLERETLGRTERFIVRMVKSPWGDYRPWDEIDQWADSIAKELSAVPA